MSKHVLPGNKGPHKRKWLLRDEAGTQIKPSPIHGMGVFAVRAIPKGTSLFGEAHDAVLWVKEKELRQLPGEIRRLYADYCIVKEKGSLPGCPQSFNEMTVSWYLNHSAKPNVGCDRNVRVYTLRKVKVGEELTVDYGTYSDFA